MTAHWQSSAARQRAPMRKLGRSRGQALVEFSLVIIPFCVIFFSTVEFALIMASLGTFNFSVSDAARIGSVLGRGGTTTVVDGQIIADIRNHTKGFVMAKLQEVDVYRAAPDGQCWTAIAPSTGSEVAVTDPACIKNVYDINGNLQNPAKSPLQNTVCVQKDPAPWPTCARDDSLANADYLGVRVKYNYTYLTGFIAAFGSTLTLSAFSVQRIEPVEYTGFDGARASIAATWRESMRHVDGTRRIELARA